MSAPVSVLLVSYVWPPTGGVGSLRALKLAKYLPAHGVKPVVLTVANPSVPLVDSSLLREVPPGLEVLRVPTLEPGYASKQKAWQRARALDSKPGLGEATKRRLTGLVRQALIPDPQVLWQPAVQRLLLRRLMSRQDDVVFVTAPPFSTFLSAPLVRAVGRASLVLDYRDEWITLRREYEMLSRWGAVAGGAMEHAVLRCASAVTVATDAFRDHLLERFRFLDPSRVITIPNGYDPDDIPAGLCASAVPPTDRFVITYAGTIFKQNSPRGLLAALRLLQAQEPELSKLLTVRFIGRVVETELDTFEGSESLGVERVGFVEKDQVMPALAASHMTLCLLDTMPGAERIYPAKIFELMKLGRPCLTITPPGALADLATRHQLGPVADPRDHTAIANLLAHAVRAWRAGTFEIRSTATDIERYDRRAIAGRFADLFRELTPDAPSLAAS